MQGDKISHPTPEYDKPYDVWCIRLSDFFCKYSPRTRLTPEICFSSLGSLTWRAIRRARTRKSYFSGSLSILCTVRHIAVPEGKNPLIIVAITAAQCLATHKTWYVRYQPRDKRIFQKKGIIICKGIKIFIFLRTRWYWPYRDQRWHRSWEIGMWFCVTSIMFIFCEVRGLDCSSTIETRQQCKKCGGIGSERTEAALQVTGDFLSALPSIRSSVHRHEIKGKG